METIEFCFRCEEASEWGRTNIGTEEPDIYCLQEELAGALIGLAKSCRNHQYTEKTTDLILDGLAAAAVNAGTGETALRELIDKIHQEKNRVEQNCESCTEPCKNTDDYSMDHIWAADADVRSLKFLILFGICGMAADVCQAKESGYHDSAVTNFFIKALSVIGYEMDMEQLIPVMIEVGEMNFKCIELLDNVSKEKGTTSFLLEESAMMEEDAIGLPFSIGFSWQETKTVCFYLTLLYLGNRTIFVEGNPPFFLSENVLKYMTEHYNVAILNSDGENLA